jgi:hypothetical protein
MEGFCPALSGYAGGGRSGRGANSDQADLSIPDTPVMERFERSVPLRKCTMKTLACVTLQAQYIFDTFEFLQPSRRWQS